VESSASARLRDGSEVFAAGSVPTLDFEKRFQNRFVRQGEFFKMYYFASFLSHFFVDWEMGFVYISQ